MKWLKNICKTALKVFSKFRLQNDRLVKDGLLRQSVFKTWASVVKPHYSSPQTWNLREFLLGWDGVPSSCDFWSSSAWCWKTHPPTWSFHLVLGIYWGTCFFYSEENRIQSMNLKLFSHIFVISPTFSTSSAFQFFRTPSLSGPCFSVCYFEYGFYKHQQQWP